MAKIEEIKLHINIMTSIESSFILNEIFSFLNMKRKLNLMIYNKQLQKKQEIDIEDYKNISGKYKIGGKNGLGSEYILKTNKLVFRGDYLNGVKNGQGKEYCVNGKLKFEGEYLKGKRNGNGKEYDNDILIYEGEYLNEERNGNGKEYNCNGKLIYEGEYLNGKKWNGIVFDLNDNFEYEIKDGQGYIKEYYDNGKLKFEGEYLNGIKWNGTVYFEKMEKKIMNEKDKIIIYHNNFIKYDFLNNSKLNEKDNCDKNEYIIKDGKGKIKEYDDYGQLKFEGEYLNGKRWNGKGFDRYGKLRFEGDRKSVV